MNNSRDKFEAWANSKGYSTRKLFDGSTYCNDGINISLEAWQAATEQSQKEIAELEANNDKVKLALASIRDIFEYDDEMVMSGALSYPEDVAGFVKTKVATLQAREKELVEALRYVNKELIMYGYQYESKDSINVVLNEALANVRGE